MAPTCECGQHLSRGGRAPGMRLTCPACGRVYQVVRTPEGLALAAQREEESDPWPEGLPDGRGSALELQEPDTDGLPEELLTDAPRTEGVPRARPWDTQRPREPVSAAARRSWWGYLVTAWIYPLRGHVKWTLLLLAVAYFIFPFVPVAGYIVLLRTLLPLLILGFLVLFEFEVIRQSGWEGEGEAALPGWNDLAGSALHSLGLLMSALFVSALPAAVVYGASLALDQPPWWEAAMLVGVLASLFILPIHLLAVGMAEDIAALSPVFTLPALARIPLPYTVFCLVAAATLGSAGWLLYWMYTHWWLSLLALFGAHLLLLYVLTALARALGMLHFAYADRIGWLREMK